MYLWLLLIVFCKLFPLVYFTLLIGKHFHSSSSLVEALSRSTLVYVSLVLICAYVPSYLLIEFPFIWTFGIAIVYEVLRVRKSGWRKPRLPILRNNIGVYWGIALATLVGLLAILVPANNWDGMTYHLARVDFWLEQGSINHFDTNISRQTSQPPLAEILILHLNFFFDSNFLAGLVQWVAYLGSAIVVGDLCRRLIQRPRSFEYGFLLSLSLPMAIVQGSSVQNDMVLAFFGLLALRYLIILWKDGWKNKRVFCFTWAIGFMLLTKGTGYVYSIPLLAGLAILWYRYRSWYRLTVSLAATLLMVSMQIPHWSGNQVQFGNSLGPDYELIVKSPNSSSFISNTVKGASQHLRSPIPILNKSIEKAVNGFHSAIRWDINDTRSHFAYAPPFRVETLSYHEDSATAPWHFLLLLLALIAGFWKHKGIDKNLGMVFWIFISSMFLFLLLLKYNVWISRLQIYLFLAGTPLMVWSLMIQSKWIRKSILTLIAASSIAWVVLNPAKPLVGNDNVFTLDIASLTYINRGDIKRDYQEALSKIDAGNTVGLMLSSDSYCYTISQDLRKKGSSFFHYRARYEGNNFLQKQARANIIWKTHQGSPPEKIDDFKRFWMGNTVALYR